MAQKKVIRINQKDFTALVEKNLREQGFLSDNSAFAGGSFRQAPEPAAQQPKTKLFLTTKQISFLEDILMNVNPDNEEEKDMLFKINHMLRDCLVNT